MQHNANNVSEGEINMIDENNICNNNADICKRNLIYGDVIKDWSSVLSDHFGFTNKCKSYRLVLKYKT